MGEKGVRNTRSKRYQRERGRLKMTLGFRIDFSKLVFVRKEPYFWNLRQAWICKLQ